MTQRRAVWLFLSMFVVSLCALAPATLVTSLLEKVSGGNLSLAQAKGTVWNGSGVLLLQHDTHFLPLGRYGWRILPAANLSRINMNMHTGNDGMETQIQISPWTNAVEVDHAHAVLPAQLLAVFLPQLSPYRLSGELELTTERFTIAPHNTVGALQLDWKQATSGLTDIAPLGEYRIALQGKGSSLNATLSTLSGKLKLDGSGTIEPGAAMTFNGTAQAAPEQQEALAELLHHIGPELSPGVFTFALLSH